MKANQGGHRTRVHTKGADLLQSMRPQHTRSITAGSERVPDRPGRSLVPGRVCPVSRSQSIRWSHSRSRAWSALASRTLTGPLSDTAPDCCSFSSSESSRVTGSSSLSSARALCPVTRAFFARSDLFELRLTLFGTSMDLPLQQRKHLLHELPGNEQRSSDRSRSRGTRAARPAAPRRVECPAEWRQNNLGRSRQQQGDPGGSHSSPSRTAERPQVHRNASFARPYHGCWTFPV